MFVKRYNKIRFIIIIINIETRSLKIILAVGWERKIYLIIYFYNHKFKTIIIIIIKIGVSVSGNLTIYNLADAIAAFIAIILMIFIMVKTFRKYAAVGKMIQEKKTQLDKGKLNEEFNASLNFYIFF